MSIQELNHLIASESTEYTHQLARFNFCYTIKEHSPKSMISEIHVLDDLIFTYSKVDASKGIFFRESADNRSFLGIRFIKNGAERYFNEQSEIHLHDYSLGIFDLACSSQYERSKQTEGINIFLEKTPYTKVLLPEQLFGISVDASSGVGRYLLDSFFSLQKQLTYCSKDENLLILNHLLSLLCDWMQQRNISMPQKKTSPLIFTATTFIHTYLWDSTLSLEKTAEQCHVSPRTLQKSFQSMNLSFSSYVNDLRLAVAAVKLFQTDDEITSIAFQCGFTNSSYFSKRFKEKYRLTPKNYRKEKQKLLRSDCSHPIDCPLTFCRYQKTSL